VTFVEARLHNPGASIFLQTPSGLIPPYFVLILVCSLFLTSLPFTSPKIQLGGLDSVVSASEVTTLWRYTNLFIIIIIIIIVSGQRLSISSRRFLGWEILAGDDSHSVTNVSS